MYLATEGIQCYDEHMIFLNQLLAALWILFIVYWIVSAFKSKKTVKNSYWQKGAIIRVIAIVVIILLFQTNTFRQLALQYDSAPHELLGIIGVILCVTGLGFAVWARVHIGRNWGMPMTLKKDAELVMTGPYKLVRHPIYTGILLASLGSSLTDGLWWFVFFIFYIVYLVIYSVPEEEKIMMNQFPTEYAGYRKRTKMLIPFIL